MSDLKETAYDVVEDSVGTYIDKKRYNKEMSNVLRDAAKETGVDAATLRRVKDYVHYKKMGWIDNNPFELDPKEKFKDRVSPIFIKLLTLLQDVTALGMEDILDEYLSKMEACGVRITFADVVPPAMATDTDRAREAVYTASDYQGKICVLADKIRDEDSARAEELGFGPKKEYVKLIDLYAQKKDGKDVDDKIQQVQTDLLFAQSSYEQVMTDTINSDPSKNPPEAEFDED